MTGIIVYVLESLINGKRYVGITKNLEQRMIADRLKKTKGGQILKKFKIIHTESFSSYAEARIREKYLKTGAGREWLSAKHPKLVP